MSSLLALISGNGDPVYNVSQSTTSISEGSSVVFTITTVNVAPSTTLYWSINPVSGTVNSNDFQGGSSTGSFVTDSNGTGSVSITLSTDYTLEGSESFQFQVRTGSISGTVVATSSTITIADTSSGPTYSVSPSSSTVNEGSSVTFTINTNGVANGTTLYYTVETITGTINSSDFSSGSLSGSVNISGASGIYNTGGSASVSYTLTNDVTTEGSESFRFQVRTGSISGTVVATSTIVTIGDTSIAADITYYVVSGGGGGGTARQGPPGPGDALDCASGGGGGGGYLTGIFTATIGSPYPINIGAGGGVYPTATQSVPGVRGGSSTFGPITSTGGAGGEISTDPFLYSPWFHNTNGSSGSGGAGGYVTGGASVTGNTANPASQGYPGGNGSSNPGTNTGTPTMLAAGGGGGGGGAGGTGGNASPTSGGTGGSGLYVPLFGAYISGGGGGGCNVYNGSAGSGTNGGGNGGQTTPSGPTGTMNPSPTGSAAAGGNAPGSGGGGGGAAVALGDLNPGGGGYGAGAFGGIGGAGRVGLSLPVYHTITVGPGLSYTQPSPTVFVFTSGSGPVTFN